MGLIISNYPHTAIKSHLTAFVLGIQSILFWAFITNYVGPLSHIILGLIHKWALYTRTAQTEI